MINIALDLFASVIVLVIFISSLFEKIKKESNSVFFPLLLATIEFTLFADVLAWICEGNTELAFWNLLGTALSSCFAYLAICFFLLYLRTNLFTDNKAMTVIVSMLISLCIVTMFVYAANMRYNVLYFINEEGHVTYINGPVSAIVQMIIPIICFIAMVIMIFMAKGRRIGDKLIYVISVLFPIAGAIFDYSFHGYSLTYIGFVIFAVVLYTNIYLQNRRIIASQRTALMLSQINPHFMYNTLTAIASLCDTDPKQAQSLTIGFSSYLRQNIGTLNDNNMIPFEQEIKHVETYLRIEKARFGDKINVIYQLHAEDFAIPSLTIQPIVENAIKHGLTKKSNGGTVKVLSYREKKFYVIEIIDDGTGYDTEKHYDDTRDHIGLLNVSERLKAICNGSLEVKSKIGVGTRVTVKIPARKAKTDEHTGS